VLATGGMENARLMLVSDDYKGLGNEHDVVGRYFMDHVWGHDGIGRAVLSRPPPNISLYKARGVDSTVGHAVRGVLTLDPALQKRHGLLQCSVLLQPIKRRREGKVDRALAATVFDLDNGLADDDRNVGRKPYLARIHLDPELAPDPSNRVTLAKTKDKLGVRRIRLIWNLTDLDTDSMRRTVDLFSQRLGALGQGRVRVQFDATYDWHKLRYNKHHMGTTRMADDPKQGVVDRNCKVHGLGNLWIGGSSVFPTGGFANPTFTIVALTLRLAAHLEKVLKG
jgi:choline dehydrogenase-like flavoprotein